MNEQDWRSLCDDLKLNYKENQYKFYERSSNFIKSEQDIEINQGGMGLGKTFAMCKLIKDYSKEFDHIFVATPISQIKNEWTKEMNKLNLDFAIWFSKSTHCIEKLMNPKFDVKNCNDDNPFNEDLEYWEKDIKEKVYTEKCKLLGSLINYQDFNINKYYKLNKEKGEKEHCFIPINKYHLKTKDILIGDYFGFLFPDMYKKITQRRTDNSCLLIDEAHMIPQRVSGLLSKSLYLNKNTREMKEEINRDYYIIHRMMEYIKVVKGIEILEKIAKKLINNSKNKGDKEGRYTLPSFISDWEELSLNEGLDWSVKDFRDNLDEFNKSYQREDENEDDDTNSCERFVKFIDNWYEKYNDENYSENFQYYDYQEGEIELKVVCKNPASYLSKLWVKWNKIIMMSGTIPDEEYFKNMLGLNHFNIINEPILNSYKIKDDILVYPIGNFISKGGARTITYENNKELLINILNNLSGRTIIYVQSKTDSRNLEQQLKELFKIYNFSMTKKGFYVDNNLLNKLKEDFAKENKAIAITHITGKVEGQNYVDENGNNIKNIIIYGFPYPRKGLEYIDKLDYYSKLFGFKKAKEYVNYYPPNTTIYQAVMRAKRDTTHKPIIILWGKDFAKGSPGHKYTYDELKGEIIYDSEELINLVRKKENERRNI